MCTDTMAAFTLVPVFGGCSAGELRAIARTADYVEASPGVVVSSSNERLNPIVIVVRGKLCVIDEGGVATAGEGAVVGAAEVLAGRARTSQLVASSDVALLLIEPRHFPPLLNRCPNFAVGLLHWMARQASTPA